MASSNFPGWLLKAIAGNGNDVSWSHSIPYIAAVDDDLWTYGKVVLATLLRPAASNDDLWTYGKVISATLLRENVVSDDLWAYGKVVSATLTTEGAPLAPYDMLYTGATILGGTFGEGLVPDFVDQSLYSRGFILSVAGLQTGIDPEDVQSEVLNYHTVVTGGELTTTYRAINPVTDYMDYHMIITGGTLT